MQQSATGCRFVKDGSIEQRRPGNFPAEVREPLDCFLEIVYLRTREHCQCVCFPAFYESSIGVGLRIVSEQPWIKILQEIPIAQLVEIGHGRQITGEIGFRLIKNAISSGGDWRSIQRRFVDVGIEIVQAVNLQSTGSLPITEIVIQI